MTDAQSDRNKLHELLIKAGERGVNSLDATYILNLGKQVNVRKHELQHDFKCVFTEKPKRLRNGSVIWIHLGCKGYVAPVKPTYIPSWNQPMESYVKDGRTYWREITEPTQQELI